MLRFQRTTSMVVVGLAGEQACVSVESANQHSAEGLKCLHRAPDSI